MTLFPGGDRKDFMIYLDNAATSGTKPESVYEAVNHALREVSGNPGRSGHKVSLEAGSLVQGTRLGLAQLFHIGNAEQIVFTMNATDALNTAILGTAGPSSHIVTTSMEHNSVARPLFYLESLGAEVTKVRADLSAGVDPEEIRRAIRPDTALVAVNHVSNVTGTVNDIGAIGKICREAGVPFLVDASQSAGALPIDVEEMCIDLLAFPGHKSLLGPQGTGALYIRPGVELLPFRRGGTGSRSELLTQPELMPDKYESGTLNVPGIAGLGAGVRFLLDTGVDAVHAKEEALVLRLIKGLSEMEGVTVYAPREGCPRGSVLSFTVAGQEVQDISMMLDMACNIAVRAGLHCAPDAHRTFGTFDGGGTVRVSPGYFTTEEEIDAFLEGMQMILAGI